MRILWLTLCVLWIGLTPAWAEDFKTVEVIPGVYTVAPASGQGANATFLVTEEGVLVVDTGGSPAAGRALKQAIAQVTPRPVILVINTHHHPDNTYGNEVFPEVPRIAHEEAARLLLGRTGKKALARYQAEHPQSPLTLTPPNITFQKEMSLRFGKFFLRLIHPPAAHTEGDLYVYVPSHRLIITGGLVNKGHLPDLSEAGIDAWIQALRRMEDLDAETIIPGYGPWGGKPTITLMKHYLMELKRYVQDALQDGGSLPAIQGKVRGLLQPKYGTWAGQERMDANIARAFFEYIAP